MKKILLTVAMTFMAMGGYAETEDTYVGWPANYGGVMLQGFWWDSYDATKWTNLTARAGELSQYFNLIWVPNSGMTSDYYYNQSNSMGYDPCFWLDHTSCFGTETELREMINTYQAKGVGIIEDVVINHKNGFGSWVNFAQEEVVGKNTGKTYSLTWDNTNYSGICSNDECNGSGYPTTGANDSGDNFDGYRDLDHSNQTVKDNIITYLDFLKNELGYAGFRYDMVKGYAAGYIYDYNTEIQPKFSVGEYWDNQTNIQNWISNTSLTSAAFDFPLKTKLNTAISGGNYSALEWKSFSYSDDYKQYAITFAENHDTGRNSDQLQYNWSAANAFILASPGTPCVWLKHYEADPNNIGAMILARKAAGITNTGCTVLTQASTNDNGGYILETQGEYGLVYCQFGNAVNNGTPTPSSNSNFTGKTYQLIASGDAYKFYATEPVAAKPMVAITPSGGDFYTSALSLTFTPNSIAQTAWYRIGENGAQTSISAETLVNYNTTINAGESIIVYWGAKDANGTENTGSVTFTKADRDPERIYFRNTAGWENVYCYAWNADGYVTNAWPGDKVSADDNGYYSYHTGSNFPTYVIWNNGSGTQTSDLEYSANNIYNYSANTGDTYSSTVTGSVSLNNLAGWSNVYCYAWDADGLKLGTWPGEKVTATSDGKYVVNFYGETPEYVIWSNNEGTQTPDLAYNNGGEFTNLRLYLLGTFNDWKVDNASGYEFVSSENHVWTYTFNLNGAENPTFKLYTPTSDGKWFGWTDLDKVAPSGWISQATSDDNIQLNSTTTNCDKYLMTAKWRSNDIASGWELKIEGVYTYTVAGSDAVIFGNEWNVTNTENDMILNESGIYELTKEHILLEKGTTYEYKVASNHSWNESYGYNGSNATFEVNETGYYTLVFSFDPESTAVDVTSTKEQTFIVDGTYHPLNHSVTLTDGNEASFSSDVESFTAKNASYSRSASNQWGTLCLPFQIMNKYDGVTFYELSKVDKSKQLLYFEPTTTIGAGTPVIYKVEEADATSNKYELSINESNVQVKNEPTTVATDAGWTLNGTFRELANLNASEGQYLYYIASNKFWQGTDTTIPAYRAWFTTTDDLGDVASQAPFRIVIDDGTEGINIIEQEDGSIKVRYDLTGRKLTKRLKGLMIENGKVIFVK